MKSKSSKKWVLTVLAILIVLGLLLAYVVAA